MKSLSELGQIVHPAAFRGGPNTSRPETQSGKEDRGWLLIACCCLHLELLLNWGNSVLLLKQSW